jgi:hypothetical protein
MQLPAAERWLEAGSESALPEWSLQLRAAVAIMPLARSRSRVEVVAQAVCPRRVAAGVRVVLPVRSAPRAQLVAAPVLQLVAAGPVVAPVEPWRLPVQAARCPRAGTV